MKTRLLYYDVTPIYVLFCFISVCNDCTFSYVRVRFRYLLCHIFSWVAISINNGFQLHEPCETANLSFKSSCIRNEMNLVTLK